MCPSVVRSRTTTFLRRFGTTTSSFCQLLGRTSDTLFWKLSPQAASRSSATRLHGVALQSEAQDGTFRSRMSPGSSGPCKRASTSTSGASMLRLLTRARSPASGSPDPTSLTRTGTSFATHWDATVPTRLPRKGGAEPPTIGAVAPATKSDSSVTHAPSPLHMSDRPRRGHCFSLSYLEQARPRFVLD